MTSGVRETGSLEVADPGRASALCIGLVEDDADQARLYTTWLEESGYRVLWFGTAGDFRRKPGAASVDAVLLDWGLPDAEGPEVVDWLRHSAHAGLPVVFLTARVTEADVVAGLRAGADDYVAKPPRRAELLARLGAVLRRTGAANADPVLRDVPPWEIDTRERRVLLAGEEIELTDREFDLAAYLFRRPGRIVSRDALLSQVWNLGSGVATRTVDTHVSRLRRKLALDGEHGWRLTAVYQHGYRLERA
jgi:two-component system response regulator RegX3